MEVIVRGEAVETAQPGDHCDFIGTLIAVPDVAMLSAPGLCFIVLLIPCLCNNLFYF